MRVAGRPRATRLSHCDRPTGLLLSADLFPTPVGTVTCCTATSRGARGDRIAANACVSKVDWVCGRGMASVVAGTARRTARWCSTIRCTGKVWSKSTTPGQPRGIRRAGADLSLKLPAIRPVRAPPNRPCPDVGARHEETDAHARSSVRTTSNSSLTSRWPARGHGKASAASSVAGQEQT